MALPYDRREGPQKSISDLVLHKPTGWYVDPDLGHVYTMRGTWEGFRIGGPNPRGTWRAGRKNADGSMTFWRLPYVIWEAVEGRRVPDNHFILHRNDDKNDLRYANLECVTASEGRRRTRPRGEQHMWAKLSDEDVRKIRESNAPVVEIVKQYQVSDTTVYDIRGYKRRP